MAKTLNGRRSRALAGEDIATASWDDVQRWLAIYAELLRFKRRLLAKIRVEMSRLDPTVAQEAQRDIEIVTAQMVAYEVRHAMWTRRAKQMLRGDGKNRTADRSRRQEANP
jgi:hypothetical protein